MKIVATIGLLIGSAAAFSPQAANLPRDLTQLQSAASYTTTEGTAVGTAQPYAGSPLATMSVGEKVRNIKLSNGYELAPSAEPRFYIVGLESIVKQQLDLNLHCTCTGHTSRNMFREFTSFCGGGD